MTIAARGLPSMTMASVTSTTSGAEQEILRVEHHPDRDEEKDREGVAHRESIVGGPEAEIATAPTIMPARNAPSSIDTPKKSDDPTAMPSASTSTVSVKSSREPVSATLLKSHGITRPPIGNATAMSNPIFRTARPRAAASPLPPPSSPLTNSTGSMTSTRTVKRSSTTSQPTAMWPVGVCSSLLSDKTRTSTTVLATESASPKTAPAVHPQPNAQAATAPEPGRDRALEDRAGQGDSPHREQLVDVEVQPDAEHDQDDADLGELLGEVRIGLEAGRVAHRQRCRRGDSRRWAKVRAGG